MHYSELRCRICGNTPWHTYSQTSLCRGKDVAQQGYGRTIFSTSSYQGRQYNPVEIKKVVIVVKLGDDMCYPVNYLWC